MEFFQNSVLNKYLKALDKQVINAAYTKFRKHFLNPAIQENIRNLKEEEYQEGFLNDLFVNVLGYRKNPTPNYNLKLENKNVKDSRKADGAIIFHDEVKAVIELKGTDTTDLTKIEDQAFGYKNNQRGCIYVITSNFEKLRFYIDNTVEHIEFNLFTLTEEEFELLYLCLARENLESGIPRKIKDESISHEDVITKQLYNDYSLFKRELHQNLVLLNTQYDPLTLFKKSQKLLDRFLFLFFAEDRQLLPPNSVKLILNDWKDLKDRDVDIPLYDRFRNYFEHLNTGYKGKRYIVFAYNGGLFRPDAILDTVRIDDDLLFKHTFKLSEYDFASEVDVNILGHIFENSLNELDEIKAQLEGQEIDKSKTKRKKDGVFYTPKYITKYIVDNTIGKLCNEKKTELQINEEEYVTNKKRQKKTTQTLAEKLTEYRNWLVQLTVCDPACGSGAFLNQALNFLITEHRYIDELYAKLFGDAMVLSDIEKSILENNLFGVDLNEESVEIAKLSLWLRTARPNRKLNDLNNNIKCGNSLIDDPAVAGDKAFNWQNEFQQIFERGGFDIVIGNPPYGALLDDKEFYSRQYGFKTNCDTYQMFSILASKLLNLNGICGFIIPNSWMNRKGGIEFRQKLFNFNFYYVVDFINQVFEDANIDTCIIIYSNSSKTNYNKSILAAKVIQPETITSNLTYNEIHFENWIKYDKFNCELNDTVFKIFEKLKANSIYLGELTTITGGYKPYQVGYGKSIEGDFPQTKNDVENWVYHSDVKIDESYFPDIKGSNIQHYYIKPNSQWVKWGSWLMSPKKKEDFTNPKIVVREVAGIKLNSCYDESGYFTNDTTHMIRGVDSETLKFILTNINSKLLGWYFRIFFGEANDLFPKIKVNELKDLPIKKLSLMEQLPFIEKANSMLSLNKELQELLLKFQSTIRRKFVLYELPSKLQNWHLLTYAEFITELSKKKIKLSLSNEAEWETYFLQESKMALDLKSRIEATDKEIDQMVYALYELTEKEINIIENT
jgi:type I restriction-modification system DNA methylase subunit